MWLHASPAYIAEGDLILPPGDARLARWPGAMQAEKQGWYRADRVYVFWSDGAVPPAVHIDRFDFVTSESYLYEVEPIGELESDPVAGGHESWRCCAGARAVTCQLSPAL